MNIVLPQEHAGEVTSNTKLSPKVYWLTLQLPQALKYEAGQYASFLIDEHRRPLSYATPAGNTKVEFLIDISPNGVASKYTEQLSLGDHVKFLSPYGRFVIDHTNDRPLLFIAGGTGIAPIRAQILDELQRARPRSMTLIYGNQNGRFMFMADEFAELATQHEQLTFTPCRTEADAPQRKRRPSSLRRASALVSRRTVQQDGQEADPKWSGEVGLVSDVAARTVSNIADHDVYVCGSPTMVEGTVAMLENQGVPKNHIYLEQFK